MGGAGAGAGGAYTEKVNQQTDQKKKIKTFMSLTYIHDFPYPNHYYQLFSVWEIAPLHLLLQKYIGNSALKQ